MDRGRSSANGTPEALGGHGRRDHVQPLRRKVPYHPAWSGRALPLHGFVLVESTESPHCIALQVATVRYNVEDKRAVTCDDAQTPGREKGESYFASRGSPVRVRSSPPPKCWSEAIGLGFFKHA